MGSMLKSSQDDDVSVANPFVVGLVLNYRDSARTGSCIESLLVQNLDTVLVWDNSADEGVSARAINGLFKGNPKVKIITSVDNLGFSAGVNRGLEVIRQDFAGALVLLINNDARLLPGAVAKLAKVFMGDSSALLAYPAIDHAGEIIGTVYYHRWLGIFLRHCRAGSFAYPSGCCLMINLSKSDGGLFDEKFFMYGEDVKLGWELGREPGRMVHVPELLVLHDVSAGSKAGSLFYESRMVAAHWLLVRDLSNKWSARLLMYSSRLTMLSLRAILRALRYRNLDPVRALYYGWKITRGTADDWLAHN